MGFYTLHICIKLLPERCMAIGPLTNSINQQYEQIQLLQPHQLITMNREAIAIVKKCLKTKDPYLDLGRLGLTDEDFTEGGKLHRLLKQCIHVQTLVLSNLEYEWHINGDLKSMRSSSSFNNSLSCVPKAVIELKQLTKFCIEGVASSYREFNLNTIPYLGEGKKLRQLYIGFNHINEIKGLESLINLEHLELSGNRISEIKGLTENVNLLDLRLRANKILEISGLGKLTSLKILDLSKNQISEIGGLDNLMNLEGLSLAENQISELRGLDNIPSLKWLHLYKNQISEIKGLANLPNLNRLILLSNVIRRIEGLDNLGNLNLLDISSNLISDITPLLPWLNRSQSPLQVVFEKEWHQLDEGRVNIYNNPLTTPPMEVAELGNEAVLRYFENIATQGFEKVYEAKLVLTGSGESGKTSLSWRLNKKDCPLPQKDERTKEVEVSDYKFLATDGKTFNAHIWDFGGQQIIHNFHRLFMNDSALYVLLTETSRENDDFDYWLQTIRLFGGESPILFVQNKRNGVPRRLNITPYKPYFNIKDDLYEVNLLNNEGLPDLEAAIQRYIQQLPIVQRTIPRYWFQLREQLDKQTVPYISYAQFVAICNNCNIKKREDIEDAGDFLHQLGILLWYRNNPALHDKIILERQWATRALFQLVFDEKINQQQKGYFTLADAKAIWDKEEQYCHHSGQLVSLMQEFKLAYKQRHKKDAYIIPALLPSTAPKKAFDVTSRLTVMYQYVHLPRGIVNQLTAELCHKIENDEYTWSEGVWLKEGNTEARITENRATKTIAIEIAGVQNKELFGGIKAVLDNIHSEYKGVMYELKIPCVCSVCKDASNKHYYDYQSIITRLEARKKNTIECVISGEDVSLWALLDNLLPLQHSDNADGLIELLTLNFEKLHLANMKTHSDLGMVKNELTLQHDDIIQLIELSQQGQQTLVELLQKIDTALSNEQAAERLAALDAAINERLSELPQEIVNQWAALNSKANDGVEVKAKLKLKVPIIPFLLDYEGEVAFDMKKLRKKLQEIVF